MAIVTNADNQNVLAKLPNNAEHSAGVKNQVDTVDPTSTDDELDGFAVGSTWLNEAGPSFWFCKDATAGAAIWQQVSSAATPDSIRNFISNFSAEYNADGWASYNDSAVVTASGATAQNTGDTITLNSHGLTNGQSVYLTSAPSGLSSDTRYYVVNSALNTFQVSLTRDGAVVPITADGSGIGIYNVSPSTGIVASGDISFDILAATNLRDLASFRFSKGAANKGGHGVRYPFTIDKADRGRPLGISFEFQIESGTYNSGDLEVWIYDVTNAGLIVPSVIPVDHIDTTKAFAFSANFISAVNSTSYRLLLHNTNVSSNAYVLALDSVRISPEATPPLVDGEEYRVASSTIVLTAAHKKEQTIKPLADLIVKLPSAGIRAGDKRTIINPSPTYYTDVQGSSSGTVWKFWEGSLVVSANQDNPTTSAHWDIVRKWTKPCYAKYHGLNANPSANTPYKFQTQEVDTHSAYSSSTGLFTVPKDGRYVVTSLVNAGSTSGILYASVNGATSADANMMGYSVGGVKWGTVEVTATKGQSIAVQCQVTESAFSGGHIIIRYVDN